MHRQLAAHAIVGAVSDAQGEQLCMSGTLTLRALALRALTCMPHDSSRLSLQLTAADISCFWIACSQAYYTSCSSFAVASLPMHINAHSAATKAAADRPTAFLCCLILGLNWAHVLLDTKV